MYILDLYPKHPIYWGVGLLMVCHYGLKWLPWLWPALRSNTVLFRCQSIHEKVAVFLSVFRMSYIVTGNTRVE